MSFNFKSVKVVDGGSGGVISSHGDEVPNDTREEVQRFIDSLSILTDEAFKIGDPERTLSILVSMTLTFYANNANCILKVLKNAKKHKSQPLIEIMSVALSEMVLNTAEISTSIMDEFEEIIPEYGDLPNSLVDKLKGFREHCQTNTKVTKKQGGK